MISLKPRKDRDRDKGSQSSIYLGVLASIHPKQGSSDEVGRLADQLISKETLCRASLKKALQLIRHPLTLNEMLSPGHWAWTYSCKKPNPPQGDVGRLAIAVLARAFTPL